MDYHQPYYLTPDLAGVGIPVYMQHIEFIVSEAEKCTEMPPEKQIGSGISKPFLQVSLKVSN